MFCVAIVEILICKNKITYCNNKEIHIATMWKLRYAYDRTRYDRNNDFMEVIRSYDD